MSISVPLRQMSSRQLAHVSQLLKQWGQEPPLIWLVEFYQTYIFFFMPIALFSMVRTVVMTDFRVTHGTLMTVTVTGFLGTVPFLSLWVHFKRGVSLQIYHFLSCVAYCFCVFLTTYSASLGTPIYRHRSAGFIAMAWRATLPMIAIRRRHSLVCIVVNTTIECYVTSTVASQNRESQELPRMLVTLLMYSVLCVFWCIHQQLNSNKLFETQQRLIAEKSAFESLLSAMTAEKSAFESMLSSFCDADFWVAPDGDTVLRSDQRLDAILGCAMVGNLLSAHVPDYELERLRKAFDRFGDGKIRAPATLLPTAFLCSDTSTSVDLFIIDRRQDFGVGEQNEITVTQAGNQFGFLVGVRLTQTGSNTDSGTGDENTVQTAAQLAADIVARKASRTPTPETKSSPDDAANDIVRFVTQLELARDGSEHSESCLQSVDDRNTNSNGNFIAHRKSGVLIQDDGKIKWCSVESLTIGSQILCVDTNLQPCLDVVEGIKKGHTPSWVGVRFGSSEEGMLLPLRARILVKYPQSVKHEWCTLRRALAAKCTSSVQFQMCGGGQLSQHCLDIHHYRATDEGWPIENAFDICLKQGSRCTILVGNGISGRKCGSQDLFFALSNALSVQLPADGSIASSDITITEGASILSRGKSSVRRRRDVATMGCPIVIQPPHKDPFQPTDMEYIQEAMRSLFMDLIGAMNFKVVGCCAWHSYIGFLVEQAYNLKNLHTCRDEWPDAFPDWQCENCSALMFSGQGEDACWLCSTPRDAESN